MKSQDYIDGCNYTGICVPDDKLDNREFRLGFRDTYTDKLKAREFSMDCEDYDTFTCYNVSASWFELNGTIGREDNATSITIYANVESVVCIDSEAEYRALLAGLRAVALELGWSE